MVMATGKTARTSQKGRNGSSLVAKKGARLSALVHQDSIGKATRREATSHLPPVGIHGGAQEICSRLLSGPHSPLFLHCAN